MNVAPVAVLQEDFVSNAVLADRSFEAERGNVVMVGADGHALGKQKYACCWGCVAVPDRRGRARAHSVGVVGH